MNNNQKEYEFFTSPNQKNLSSKGDGAIEAFHNLKRIDQDNYYRLSRYSPSQLPPDGFSLLSIGYGLSIAYRIVS